MPSEADTLDPATAAPAKRQIQSVKVRATPEEGEGTFEALVSNYSVTYEIGWGYYERILPGCFAESIADHPVIPVCWNHDWQLSGLIGTAEAVEQKLGLIVRGQLFIESDPVNRLYRAMKDKAVQEWSIAFYATEIIWTDDEPEVDQIVKGDLVEATSCYRGANDGTSTLDLRSQPVRIDGDLEVVKAEVIRLRSKHGGVDLERFRVETSRQRTAEPGSDPAPEPEPTPEDDKPKADAVAQPVKERLAGMREKLVKARDDAETADLALAVDELIDELSDLVEEADGAVGDLLDAVGAGDEDPDDGDEPKEDAAAQEARAAASKAFLSSRAGLELLRAQRASASGPSSSQSEGHPSPEPKEPANA